ncbi:hypothetical protein PGTUg99_010216 [Puccinia graminis f. sp. tritici]|uniref:Uncharacterized protein n=1 Tax=Puccinia graminis f. sp. tritici TaxID=56615 RepID=A0A5B0MRD3_PUCGR|nr:hypothetical protein PGTUg99_010216 [Puccinia graminis f. sp. tritici]
MAELQIEHTPASYSTHHSHHKKTSKAEGILLRPSHTGANCTAALLFERFA